MEISEVIRHFMSAPSGEDVEITPDEYLAMMEYVANAVSMAPIGYVTTFMGHRFHVTAEGS